MKRSYWLVLVLGLTLVVGVGISWGQQRGENDRLQRQVALWEERYYGLLERYERAPLAPGYHLFRAESDWYALNEKGLVFFETPDDHLRLGLPEGSCGLMVHDSGEGIELWPLIEDCPATSALGVSVWGPYQLPTALRPTPTPQSVRLAE